MFLKKRLWMEFDLVNAQDRTDMIVSYSIRCLNTVAVVKKLKSDIKLFRPLAYFFFYVRNETSARDRRLVSQHSGPSAHYCCLTDSGVFGALVMFLF